MRTTYTATTALTIGVCVVAATSLAHAAPRGITGTSTVAEVPGLSYAAPALQRFVDDLVAGDLAAIDRACWRIAPVFASYSDPDRAEALLAAVAQPGTHDQDFVAWEGEDGTIVAALHTAINSGYACPYLILDDQDATGLEPTEFTVHRFLARTVGEPVNPTDTELDYRLICPSDMTWNAPGTHASYPPLATNPALAHGITGFDPHSFTSAALEGEFDHYFAVTADITTATGARTASFTVFYGGDDPCIGDIS